jgi:hypothetical protein
MASNIIDIGAKYETDEIIGLLKKLAIEKKKEPDNSSLEKETAGVFNDSRFYFNMALNLKKTSILGYIFENILKLKTENKGDLKIFADLRIKTESNDREKFVSRKIWRLDEIDLTNDEKFEKKCTIFWPEDQENPAWDFIAINQLNGSEKEIIFYQISVTRYINTKLSETWRVHKEHYEKFEANKEYSKRYYLIHSNMCYMKQRNKPQSTNGFDRFFRERKNIQAASYLKFKNSNSTEPKKPRTPLKLIFIDQFTSFDRVLILKIIFYGDFIRKKNRLLNINEKNMLKAYLGEYKIPYKTNENLDVRQNNKIFYLYRTINKKEIFTVDFVSIIDLFKRLERNDSQARKTPNPLKNT